MIIGVIYYPKHTKAMREGVNASFPSVRNKR